MAKTRLDSKFFESTRGKIVLLLRSGSKTVNELAAALSLTDNAVRANLLTLERDRLIEQSGSVKGHRKPHFSYMLTADARHLFPKSYDSLLNVLISELKDRLNTGTLLDSMRSVGRRIGKRPDEDKEFTQLSRIQESVAKLEALGGAPRLVDEENKFIIKSESCPFAESVSEHPEVCQVAEAMIEEIVGAPVKEICDRRGTPKCCFEILRSSAV
jgi:predicted ArsR family transcriptional regulator